jgi:hypothetical protein
MYAPASFSLNISISRAAQSIVFDGLTAIATGGSGLLSAISTSGLAVNFTSATLSVCTVSSNIVSGVGAGTCTVVANQEGNATYAAAPPVTQSIQISPAAVPLLGLSTENLTFASQAPGTSSAPQLVNVSAGAVAVVITSIVASGDFSQSNSCGSSLAAGASCTVSVTFNPTASGSRTGTLTITDNASGSTQTVNLDGAATGGAVTANLVAGWNLVGNGTSGTVNVVSVFSDSAKFNTVWKWVSGDNAGWAFYTPLQPDGGAAYAASKGYTFLTTVNAGEGFWVNAQQAFSVPFGSGNILATTVFRDGSGPAGANPLPQGWSLIAVGDNPPSPRSFANEILSALAAPPSLGAPAATTLTSLWAWFAGNSTAAPGWLFYAPGLDNSGSLGSYITNKGYLDFGTLGKTLDASAGFWVNHP